MNVSFSDYLRGMDVIAEASVLITNQAHSFHWAGYGLKLHVPQGALPAGLEECRILIKVGISGHFALPQNTSLVSAVYWLDSEPRCKFLLPLTLEIQHCAKSTQTKMLSFARCSQKSPPYTFKMLEGGEFSNLSAYGCMQFYGFSLITLLKNRLPWWTRIESVKYRARLYYLMRGEDQREIHFLITKDLDSHATVCVLLYWKDPMCRLCCYLYYITQNIQQKYAAKGATIGSDLPVEFESDSISLQLPSEGDILCDGWNIVPRFSPVVRTLLLHLECW